MARNKQPKRRHPVLWAIVTFFIALIIVGRTSPVGEDGQIQVSGAGALCVFILPVIVGVVIYKYFPYVKPPKKKTANLAQAPKSLKRTDRLVDTDDEALPDYESTAEIRKLKSQSLELQREKEVLFDEVKLLRAKVSKLEQQNGALSRQLDIVLTVQEKQKAELKKPSDTVRPTNDCYVVLDLETTGIYPSFDEITEIAAVKYSNGKETDSFVTLINPKCEIPENVVELTGITDEDVADAPTIEEVLPMLAEFLNDLPIVAHNAGFDLAFLGNAFRRAGRNFENKCFDTLSLAKEAFPGLASYKLENLKNELALGDFQSHRALTDVYTTAALFDRCKERLHSFSPIPWRYLRSVPNEGPAGRRRNRQTKKASDFLPTVDYIDPNGQLYRKVIVFTGELSMTRNQAIQIAVNAGAIVKDGISMKVDYLVEGKQDLSVVGLNGMSGKQVKAHAYNDAGKANIKFINESEFMRLTQRE